VSAIRAVISDFGGVLTTPLMHSFAAFQRGSGIPLESLGKAMAKVAESDRENPLFALETGRLSERDFLSKLEAALADELGRRVALSGLGEAYFAGLDANQALFDYMRSLRERGLRLAILTNNVREWEPRWRAMLPVDEVFELVIDSAFVGMRKPDPQIYELTLERLGLPARKCLFVDDLEINCDAARAMGITAVHFKTNEQAIAELEAALDGARRGQAR
jgi:epoxide hydrolase-like predicted phosphatase